MTTPGELLGTLALPNGVTVDYYQVGTTAALEDGMWVDPDTKENLIKTGDPLV